ncbi:YceI family protein [Winogradskyella sp. A3E31]|uniref:YceI family protein n=1 Tax=Winogradskyella sp. A3E31 TaxID=3349637 RepID=UPI00398B167D
MKKNSKLGIIAILALLFMSFSLLKDVPVNVDESKIVWNGYKVTGEHEGTISLKSGHLNFDDENLTGGSFVIDMTSITVTDLSGGGKAKLEGHLKSDDFFGVEKHPEAKFVINKATKNGDSYDVTGDLTIKGITNPISFTMAVNGNIATAALKVDRAKYDVKYGSSSFFDNLKDKAIYDEFDLNVTLKF